ncbi:MAG: Crp/Fnr family transcriptional regulator [Myxococcales bacterium FL481]|nr:MAG: Crp/Fnr family transcriptional regulator [Myxococcales bacterium FL481]
MLAHTNRRPAIPLDRLDPVPMLGCVEPFVVSPSAALERLAASATRVSGLAGEVLLRAGDRPEAAFVVLRGRVNLLRGGHRGRELILACLGAGDLFGEAGVMPEGVASTTAVAAGTVELCRLPIADLRRHLEEIPATSVRMLGLLQRRLADIEGVASGLALCDVEQRLRRTLSVLARRQGRRLQEGANWVLAPVPTQTELARMVGSCRETVSRTLTAMARDGLVSTVGRKMFLAQALVESHA